MSFRPLLSDSNRRALLLIEWIAVLAVLVLGVFSMRRWHQPSQGSGVPEDSVRFMSGGAGGVDSGAGESSIVYAEETETVETFPFDPNTADSTSLLRLGLAPWQVRSIYRYRARHGRFHVPEDFKRVPGMTYELWERLAPYIRISRKFQYLSEEDLKSSAPAVILADSDTIPAARHECADVSESVSSGKDSSVVQGFVSQEKYPEGTMVDANTADTTELKRIPGIASYRARKIVEYREKLGGFVNVEQVMESCELPDEVLHWFMLTTTVTRKINVNSASVNKMMSHPYISFYKAKYIVEYRSKHGEFKSLDELVSKKLLTIDEMERLSPYLSL